MNKRRYKATNVKQINWQVLTDRVKDQRLVFSVDVAKEEFYAALLTANAEVLTTVKWSHPDETRVLGERLIVLPARRIEVVMEPSGTYGDSLRWYLKGLGLEVYQVSPKRVHDAAEVFDGVPSLHDAKAAYIIGRLHLGGTSEEWREVSEHRREQQALVAELNLYQSEHRRNLNRLEALLSRHWPEIAHIVELDRSSLLHLIAEYGSPERVRQNRKKAERLLYSTGRGFAGQKRVEAILDSTEQTLGVPCTEGERHYLQTLGKELLHTRQGRQALDRRIAEQVKNDAELRQISGLVGKATSLVLESTLGSPLNYPNAHAYLKAMGLNLKERSSGKHKGLLKITKRGPGKARYYLFFCAMRLAKDDPIVGAWYRKKVERDGNACRSSPPCLLGYSYTITTSCNPSGRSL